MTTLVIATRNAHKAEEIRAILGDGFRFLTLNDFPGAPEVIEDAATFAGNASKKAITLARFLSPIQRVGDSERSDSGAAGGVFVLADDSGLEVDALKGAPGVHSARFAALDTGVPGNSPTAANNAKLVRLLEGVPLEKRTARFRCVIALAPVMPVRRGTASAACAADVFEAETKRFDGVCEGTIEVTGRGQGGFGYDPLFLPRGFTQTFGELPETTKNRLSHRAEALRKLKAHLEARRSAESVEPEVRSPAR